MAEENKPHKPSKSSDSVQDPSALATSGSQKSKNEDPETIREPKKRRKNCPRSLDQINKSTSADGNFSFTFDTKFAQSCQEFTPKFGSFRLLVPTQEQDREFFLQSPILEDKEEEEAAVAAEEEDKKVGVVKGRELVNNTLRFLDGFNEIE